ncbi:DEAD/DEAH box helicase [Embleya sp. NPDC127516]|uniref:DEAD/DEAH box helicase n=1 Tax=Embleya sp. NPDC127516 TaxID=3363990 RepID=UPI00382B65AB
MTSVVAAVRAGCAAVFMPRHPAEDGGHMVLYRPDGAPMPPAPAEADPIVTDLVLEPSVAAVTGVRRVSVGAWAVPLPYAVPALLAPHDCHTHPAARAWADIARWGLEMIAARRVRLATTDTGSTTWRFTPPSDAQATQLRSLAAALPPHGHCRFLGDMPLRIDSPTTVTHAFLDALAATHMRTPGARHVLGESAFTTATADVNPRVQAWIDDLEVGHDPLPEPHLTLRVGRPRTGSEGFDVVPVAVHLTGPDDMAVTFDRLDSDGRRRARRALRRAARAWAPLGPLAARPNPCETVLRDTEALELRYAGGAALTAAGVSVVWPPGTVHTLDPGTVIGTRSGSPAPAVRFALSDVLDFRWRYTLEGVALTPEDMDVLATATRPLVRLRDDTWVLMDEMTAERARRPALAPMSATEALAAALSGTVTIDGRTMPCATADGFRTLVDGLREPSAGAVPSPAGLRACLREYQQRGLAWLARLTDLGMGALLADDMGLGKTVTAIALHLYRQERDPGAPTLVVCPTSLLTNWTREINRFAPGTAVHRYHGPDRSLEDVPPAAIVVTTYGVLARDHAALAARAWDLIVADEAQTVKNPTSIAARRLREIHAGAAVAVTGTPVENNLSELWAILDWVNPGLFGELPEFRARYARAAERDTDPDGEAVARVNHLVGPVILRRRKSDPDIAPELPDKVVVRRVVQPAREQVVLYEALARETMDRIRENTGLSRHGLVLKLITGLRQICNHPARFLKEPMPDTWDADAATQRSAKLAALDDILAVVRERREAAIVFTSYVATGHMLRAHLHARGLQTRFLHGHTPQTQRQDMVDAFQRGDVPVLVLSVKAAGVGLNLTRAEHVVHYDRQWNPAVEAQATDRAHRIGQHRVVHVHHLITEGTVEDRIDTLLTRKADLAEAILSTGETGLAEISDADLTELVTLGR